MSRTWTWYLGGGLLLTVLTLLLPFGLGRDLLYLAVVISAPVVIVVATVRRRPRRRLPWVLLAAGALAWAVGDVIWVWFLHVAHVEPSPSIADVFYLAAYPVLAGGLYQLARGRDRRGDLSALLDALILSTVAALLIWVILVQPAWARGISLEGAIAALYPIADVLLVAQAFYLWASPIVRTRSLQLLGLGFALVLLTDLLFQLTGYLPAVAAYELELDAGWMVSFLLWGAAALHPRMTAITDARGSPTQAFTTRRVLVLGLAFLVLPVLSLVEALAGLTVHTTAVAVVHAVLVGLVVVRMLELVGRMRQQQARLAHAAATDFLTGLDSRHRFSERIAEALDPDEVPDVPAVVVVLAGLDRFTELSDTLGHHVGDQLLRVAGAGLQEAVPGAPLARIGGDVFGLLLAPGTGPADVGPVVEALRAVLLEPMAVAGLEVAVGGAVGWVVAPQDGTSPEELLARADLALSAARHSPSGVARYDARLDDGGGMAAQLMVELPGALRDGQVVVHFQPQVEVATGRVLGAEALVRWQHPERGLISPAAFVPAAERTGLIRLLTLEVLDRAVAACAGWPPGSCERTVAVNLSVRNLLDPRLVDDVRQILERYDVQPARLELEITETMAMVDPVRSEEVLGELTRMGVTVSIDDYGTGYGSLAYLQRLPVSRLKIDRSFVAGICQDPASAAIVRSTVELARQLGLSVVAEGVEDDATLLALREMRCFAAQGFGLGRPVPAAVVVALFADVEERVPPLLAGLTSEVPVPRAR